MGTATETPPSEDSGTSRSRSPLRAVIRFMAAVMTTSGLLLLIDAGLTLTWQEPVSALITLREQSSLEEAFARDGDREGRGTSERDLRRAARRHEREVETGEAWGRIEMPTLDRDYVVVEGTEQDPLQKGPGHYPDTPLPGQPGTVAVAGHRTTYLAPFRTIDQLEDGDELVLEMPYGRFVYSVERQEIVAPERTEVIRPVDHDRLVLTACHPLYSAAERIVVFAEFESVEPV